ncbi:hypothetical protein HOLleu_38798 [Holothuria leucospilota]|uniref:Uncharacterized protein n=1 Tax=Holothuria leucospilota TaxID=206669 RepID=A0A9Q0YJ98_HOLLE|nr:hypothetical protein HOLleu_38798 [Holothuria leucospilota]
MPMFCNADLTFLAALIRIYPYNVISIQQTLYYHYERQRNISPIESKNIIYFTLYTAHLHTQLELALCYEIKYGCLYGTDRNALRSE